MTVVLTQNFLLSPGGIDLNAPIIGWKNLGSFGTIVADSEDPSFPAAMLANDATSYKWKSLSTATQYVTFTFSPDETFNYVGIARHNLGSGQIKISVEAFISGVWTEVFSEISPGTDAPLVMRFADVTGAEGARIKLVPLGATPPTIAVMFVGELTVLQRRIYVGHVPLPYGREEEFTNGVAENGDFQGRISTKMSLRTSVNLQNMTPSWYRTNLDPFFADGRRRGFFFAWRPLTYPLEVGYAWLTNNPKPQNQRPNGMMQTNMEMGGLVL